MRTYETEQLKMIERMKIALEAAGFKVIFDKEAGIMYVSELWDEVKFTYYY